MLAVAGARWRQRSAVGSSASIEEEEEEEEEEEVYMELIFI